jgi:hypothetical protein
MEAGASILDPLQADSSQPLPLRELKKRLVLRGLQFAKKEVDVEQPN